MKREKEREQEPQRTFYRFPHYTQQKEKKNGFANRGQVMCVKVKKNAPGVLSFFAH